MLRLENVTIIQGDFTLRAEFDLEKGRTYAVIGPSGAGKSTLLSAICGFIPLTAGRILWEGRNISDTPPGDRPMTMLFQDNNLFPHLTVVQNVGLGLRPDLRLSEAEKNRVKTAVERVGLVDHLDKRPGALSGGQQSRAALARVLVQARPLLLLDEPFAALGPAQRNEMLDLVRDLAAETQASLIMVTHAPADVRRIAQSAIFVEGGHAHAPQPAAELLENPPPALREYLG